MAADIDEIVLTRAQKELLLSLPMSVAESYPPAMKLVAMELAKWVEGKWRYELVATDLGQAVRARLLEGGGDANDH